MWASLFSALRVCAFGIFAYHPTPASHVPWKSLHQGHAIYMPCTRLTVKQVFLSHLSQRQKRKLWFWCNLLFANGTSSMVHSRSSPWCSPRLIHISLPIVVHDHSVSLTAAQSGLQTAPVRRMRWTYHHLFQSSKVLSAKWPTWQESFSWHTLFTNIVICNHYAIYMPSIRWTFWVMASIRRLSLNRGVSSQHPLELQWNTLEKNYSVE